MLNIHGVTASDLNERKGKEERRGKGSVGMTEPWEIIRKLLVKCETVEGENKVLKRHQNSGEGLGVGGRELRELKIDLERLQKENGNMYMMTEENRRLRKELEAIKVEVRAGAKQQHFAYQKYSARRYAPRPA